MRRMAQAGVTPTGDDPADQLSDRGILIVNENSEGQVRQLATVRVVDGVHPIENADAIERVSVGGWNVVTGKGEFQPGDQLVYFEIDSALPLDDPRFEFLAPRGTKEIDGAPYHVLRSIRLRGIVSQGLVLPTSQLGREAVLGEDVTAELGVIKYEPPLPDEMMGTALNPYPTKRAPRTDCQRIQNLSGHLDDIRAGSWIATLKIDGESTTLWQEDGELHLASRNWELAATENLPAVRYAKSAGFLDAVPAGYTVQGELYGEGIKKNSQKITGVEFAVFSVWMDGASLGRDQWPRWAQDRATPVLDVVCADTIEGIIAQADGLRITGLATTAKPAPLAEGIVFHNATGKALPWLGGRPGFKIINNKWLLKQK